MKNSSYASNRKHHVYVLGKYFTQGLQYGATIYAEHAYVKVNGSKMATKFVLFVHYNGEFKTKSDFDKRNLKREIYDFLVDYESADVP